jgi:hypothetical protein
VEESREFLGKSPQCYNQQCRRSALLIVMHSTNIAVTAVISKIRKHCRRVYVHVLCIVWSTHPL